MIMAITGKPGEGKTWELSRLLVKELKAGTPIAINYPLLSDRKEIHCELCEDDEPDNKSAEIKEGSCLRHGSEKNQERYQSLNKKDYKNQNYWRELKDLRKFKRGIIGIDEGQIFFKSRNWENLPLEIQYKLQLHRHDGLDIWLTTQNINRIDVIVRELVQEYVKMEKVLSLFGFTLFRKVEFDTDEITKELKTITKIRWVIANWRKRPLYDTLGKIPLPMTKGYLKEFIKCGECGRERPVR